MSARAGEQAGYACHASSSLGWTDPTRMPDDRTHVTDLDKDDIIMASACTVGMPCQRPVSTVRPTYHVIIKPSGAEPRERIQCSWSYVQPDLRLNLSRWWGQNCFDQILAFWNVIWTISDLFPANLIVLNAMVWSDHWDLDRKWWWWIIKRDC
jgi:hypothetical protein